jgi:tRNA threonylcarbamoyladenosine biosynthesis protein TsaB
MLVLGINTVADACEAALVDGSRIVAQVSEPMTQGHDARLAPIVDQVMREAGVAFAQLDRMAVIVGPGSFTGVRVGVSFARAMALALEIPVAGVCTMEALDALPQAGFVMGFLPAKRRPPARTWWAQLIEDGRARAAPFEIEEANLREIGQTVDAICGGLEGIPDLGIPRIAAKPTAAAAALFGARLPDDGITSARPIYVREPDAAPMRPVRT